MFIAFIGNQNPVDLNQLMENKEKDNVLVHLPSIVRENSILHKYSPYTFTDKELKVEIKYHTPSIEVI